MELAGDGRTPQAWAAPRASAAFRNADEVVSRGRLFSRKARQTKWRLQRSEGNRATALWRTRDMRKQRCSARHEASAKDRRRRKCRTPRASSRTTSSADAASTITAGALSARDTVDYTRATVRARQWRTSCATLRCPQRPRKPVKKTRRKNTHKNQPWFLPRCCDPVELWFLTGRAPKPHDGNWFGGARWPPHLP